MAVESDKNMLRRILDGDALELKALYAPHRVARQPRRPRQKP
jgi:hypothetical protein